MKKIGFGLIIGLSVLFTGCAEPVPNEDRIISSVYQIPNSSKDVIFHNTKIWIAENFSSSKAVMEYENKEEGTLIGNGSIKYPCSGLGCIIEYDWTVLFTMRVDMKNDKMKLTFDNIRIYWPAGIRYGKFTPAGTKTISRGELDEIKPKLLAFGNQLKASMDKNNNLKDW